MERLGEWSFRGYLPHYDAASTLQLITFRLADSLPTYVKAKLAELALTDSQHRRQEERYLDSGYGSRLLERFENAEIVQSALLYFHVKRYFLHAWVVMPNHLHVLIEPLNGFTIGQIVKSWKVFTSRQIAKHENEFFQKYRRIWQPDYFDRYIRDEEHYHDAVDYIHKNPVNAGLVKCSLDWRWSSARKCAGVPPFK